MFSVKSISMMTALFYYNIKIKICSNVTVTSPFVFSTLLLCNMTQPIWETTNQNQMTVTTAGKASGFIFGSKGGDALIRFVCFQQRKIHRLYCMV